MRKIALAFPILCLALSSACAHADDHVRNSSTTQAAGSLSREEMLRIYQAKNAAANRGDIDAVSDLFHPSATVENRELGTSTSGRERIRARFKAEKANLPPIPVEAREIAYGNDFIIVVEAVKVPVAGEMFGMKGKQAQSVELEGLTLYRFKDGMISAEVAYPGFGRFTELTGIPLDALRANAQKVQ